MIRLGDFYLHLRLFASSINSINGLCEGLFKIDRLALVSWGLQIGNIHRCETISQTQRIEGLVQEFNI